MLSTAIVAFREILEIALILGVILAATKNVSGRNKWVYIGLGLGITGSIILAVFADTVSNAAEGLGQELFNATVLLLASAMIGWTVVWMRKHGRAMVQRAKQMAAGIAVGEVPMYSIAVVISLASLREGSEIVLFTYGMAAAGISLFSIVAGLISGMVAGCIVGAMLYYGLIKISPKYMFAVTSWLLVLVAAGMASVAAKFLASAGYFEQLSTPVWDTSFILSEQNIIGQTFHTLLGYTARPLGIQLVFYGITLGVLIMAIRWVDRPSRVSTHTLPQTEAKLSPTHNI